MYRILAGLLISLLALFSGTAIAYADEEIKKYIVEMTPLNGSGVYATVEAEVLNGKALNVSIRASGLEPDKIHPQHVHGIDDPVKNATCPTQEADINGDGIISLAEGVPSFGPIVLPLFPFNLVEASGNLNYKASFTIKPGDLQPLHKRAVVLHGKTVNGDYIPSLPVACGELVQVN